MAKAVDDEREIVLYGHISTFGFDGKHLPDALHFVTLVASYRDDKSAVQHFLANFSASAGLAQILVRFTPLTGITYVSLPSSSVKLWQVLLSNRRSMVGIVRAIISDSAERRAVLRGHVIEGINGKGDKVNGEDGK